MSDWVLHSIRTWMRATAGRFTLLLINHSHGSGHHAHILSFNFCMCITSGAVNLITVSEIILALSDVVLFIEYTVIPRRRIVGVHAW